MKIRLPSNTRPGTATAAGPGVPDPAEPTTVAEPLVPPPVAAPGAGGDAPAPAGAVVGQVLPMYFVGDESHSMAGDPIAAVNQGLVDLRDEVAKHPLIGKKVRFGIITFAESAQTRLELSELSEDLVLPTLSPRGRGRATRARSRHCARRSPPTSRCSRATATRCTVRRCSS